VVIHAFVPSPSQGVWHVGPLPIRAYALAILAGVVVAVVMTRRRLVAVGGRAEQVDAVVGWALPFGLVGARLYHVVTDPELYFGAGRHPVRAFYVWEGGLGIWGGVAAGALGAWIGCRRHGVSLSVFADAAAPGVAVAQAIGRIGNYFNQELYGRPSTLPWALQIDPAHRPADTPNVATYQPTFLYEGLWDLGVAAVVIWAGRRYRLGAGRVFALYVALYTVGRAWVEYLRVDHANHLLGLRLNDWTCLVVFTAAAVYLGATRHRSAATGEAVDGTSAVPSPVA
jgi:prolipoprotein diacylglyceryl transferase